MKAPDMPKQTLRRLRAVVRKIKVLTAQRLAAATRETPRVASKPSAPEKGTK